MNASGERCALAIVTRNRFMPVETAFSLAMSRGIFDKALSSADDSDVARERNTAAAGFLAEKLDRVLLLDDDMVCSVDDLDTILNRDCDIVGGAYAARTPSRRHWIFIESNGRPGVLTEARVRRRAPFEVARVGTGFLSIRRVVFERLIAKKLVRAYSWHPSDVYEFFPVGIYPCPFADRPANERVSEDWGFCDLARKAGFKVYVDPLVRLRHRGYADFAGPVEPGAGAESPDAVKPIVT